MNKCLKDYVPDIERYFKEDCYCPNEVYSIDGFGFQLVYANNKAKLIAKGKQGIEDVWLFETTANTGKERCPILLNVWIGDNNKVTGCERYEVSKENIKNLKKWLKDNNYRFKLTEADELANEVETLLSKSNAIIID